jgi:hypothetical protein
MRKRSSTTDPILLAAKIFRTSLGNVPVKPPPKNPAAVALGKLGGKKGGPARAAKLTPDQRREIARAAARARWGKEGR